MFVQFYFREFFLSDKSSEHESWLSFNRLNNKVSFSERLICVNTVVTWKRAPFTLMHFGIMMNLAEGYALNELEIGVRLASIVWILASLDHFSTAHVCYKWGLVILDYIRVILIRWKNRLPLRELSDDFVTVGRSELI